jgi:hypothetical protein
MSVSAYLISASTIGIRLSGSLWSFDPYTYRQRSLPLENSAELKDGFFTPAGTIDVFYGAAGVAQAGSISDTHVFVRDVNLTTTTGGSTRRYACIPIIAHP